MLFEAVYPSTVEVDEQSNRVGIVLRRQMCKHLGGLIWGEFRSGSESGLSLNLLIGNRMID